MSRATNLKLSLEVVRKACNDARVDISAIEPLPSGDTHLVCKTIDGAETIRRSLKAHVVDGRQKRFAFYVPPSRW